jgi:SAM-dependent methyltransferase
VSDAHVQRDQPPGVPPLALTGERTLPDVPDENYWYQRHLVVYEWIARQVVGVDANPDAHEHARLRYRRENLRFEHDLVERFAPGEGCDAVVFLQTIEHLEDPAAVLDHFRAILRRGGTAYISTPNVLTLAPKGAERSGNPWHVREYRAEELAGLLAARFPTVELHGVYHRRKLRAHELAIRLGWDAVHPRVGLTGPFYSWFTPAISVRDFRLRAGVPARLQKALDFVAVCRP